MESVTIARAPVCITLGGGAKDWADSSERHGGSVVSAAIAYYTYAILASNHMAGVQITFGGHQTSSQYPAPDFVRMDDALELLGDVVRHLNVCDGHSIFVASQVPADAGLGLRGSLAAAIIKVVAFRCGLDLDPIAIADLACHIEAERQGTSSHPYEPYAAAFGGLCCVSFSSSDVVVEPLSVAADTTRILERRLMLFAPGASSQVPVASHRHYGGAKRRGSGNDPQSDIVGQLLSSMRGELERGNLDTFGRLLHRAWIESGGRAECDPFVSQCYRAALESGALGGHPTGIGGNSFLVLYCPEDRQDQVTQTLVGLGLQRWPLAFESRGVQIMQTVPWGWSGTTSMRPWPQPPSVDDAALVKGMNPTIARGMGPGR